MLEPKVGAVPTSVTFGIVLGSYVKEAAVPAVTATESPVVLAVITEAGIAKVSELTEIVVAVVLLTTVCFVTSVGVFVVQAVISLAVISVPRVGTDPTSVTFGTVVVEIVTGEILII